MKAFVLDVVVGLGGLLGVGYSGYKAGLFTDVAGGFPVLAVFSGALLGVVSVAIMESARSRTLFETSLFGAILGAIAMCLVAGFVWLLSQAGPSRAVYSVLSVIAAALVTRLCIFVQCTTRVSETTQ